MLSEKLSRLKDMIGVSLAVLIVVIILSLVTTEVLLIIILSGYLSAIIIGTIGILLSAIVLFIIRKKSRGWYGLFEIVFGLLLGGFTIARFVNFRTTVTFINFLQSRDLPTFLGLFSAAYIIVRGMDNFDEFLKAGHAEYLKTLEPDTSTAGNVEDAESTVQH
jgi:hypothetical protein